MRSTLPAAFVAASLSLAALGTGCTSTSIAVKEYFGYAKRAQLVDKVEGARDSQQKAKEQFSTALDQFLTLTGSTGSELEAKYRQVQKEYDRSDSRAQAVRAEIGQVEAVGEALFSEWKTELAQYSSPEMRGASERQLNETRAQYDRLVGVMKQAAAKMDPVLAAFKDQTLALKHNLNARAIASLQGQSARMQNEIAALVGDMEKAIAESNAFIEQMKAG